ncbi:MAG TPA: hypothetical protein VFV38_36000 [Ktedonobacteraceae bacterium]|nr:hypothetical protein [Ktedonobacteraceae bacterium]
MRKRVFPILAIPTLVLAFAALAMMPLSASAATISSASRHPAHHQPHFFLKSELHSHARHHSNAIPADTSQNLQYGGGPVMAGNVNVYAIFWEPDGAVSANYNNLILRYFGDVGSSPLYQLNQEYTDSSGGFSTGVTLAGSWVDNSAYPESPLLDSDIQNEVSNAQQANGWQSSIDNIFFVFTEQNQDICFDSSDSQCASNSFCAYHNFFGSDTIYATMPYAASFSCNPGSSPNGDDADQTINVTSHEEMEAATDPELNAWLDSGGQEIGDKCAWQFGPTDSQGGDVNWNGDEYILQQEWDNSIGGCNLGPVGG